MSANHFPKEACGSQIQESPLLLWVRREREDFGAALVHLSSEMHPWRLSAFLTPKKQQCEHPNFMTLPSEPSRMVKDVGSWSRQAPDQEHKKPNGVNPDSLLGFFSSLRMTSLHRRKLRSLCLLLAL